MSQDLRLGPKDKYKNPKTRTITVPELRAKTKVSVYRAIAVETEEAAMVLANDG